MNIEKEFFVTSILDRLDNLSISLKNQWNVVEAGKTKYFLVDDLLDLDYCNNIFNAFPKDPNDFFERDSFREKKKTSADLSNLNLVLKNFIYSFHDMRIVNKISEIVGFEDIEPDPKLYAAGLSIMNYGDFLNPHIDNSHDDKVERYRRLNLLYYVSPNWKIENGGNLELWKSDENTPLTILSKTNRLVVMETNRSSWHSVSKVQVNEPRCCLSNYYFSKKSPHSTDYFHVTSFSGRPDEFIKKVIAHVDNFSRNIIAKVFKVGRGKNLIATDFDKKK